jgi:hypothetical protein
VLQHELCCSNVTALMMCKASPVSSAIAVFDTVKLLLKAGADVDVTTGYDDTCVLQLDKSYQYQ